MTRAREKLLLVMTIKNPAQKLSSLAASLGHPKLCVNLQQGVE